ncbi:MAG: sulfite exporter TauE/SafE family protein [Armatimonadetes bacterium]|nr:sulfite exporter TauE/SafE family protein [Armatimonadota bacterium]
MDIPVLVPLELFLAGLIIFAAAVIKGTVGMGFPLVAVPLVASLMGPRPAVVIVAIPALLSNAYLVFQGGASDRRGREFAWLLAGLVVGTVLGARAMRGLDARWLSVILGTVATVYALIALVWVTARLPGISTPAMKVGVGAVAGLLGGTTAVFGPVLASYLDGLRLAKDEFVFWITVFFSVGGVVQVGTYLHLGMYRGSGLTLALLLCVPMLVGTWAGIRLRTRCSAAGFRTFVLLVIMTSGLNLIVRAL